MSFEEWWAQAGIQSCCAKEIAQLIWDASRGLDDWGPAHVDKE